METVAINTQWVETFMSISKEEIDSPTKIDSADIHPRVRATVQKYKDISDDDNNKKNKRILSESEEKFFEQRKIRMMRMQPLLANQPRLEKICKDWRNDFVDSGFTTYNFPKPIDKTFENEEDDLKYLINLCGCNLTSLSLYNYPSSQIMQLIKTNCLNLTRLVLRFKEMESKDFDNVFSNMNHLETLIIHWQCENPTLPMTLIKSLEQVRNTLKTFSISSEIEKLWPSVRVLAFDSSVLSPETEALMTVIGNMKNLEYATIKLDYGVTDELLMKLIDNCKNLISLKVRSSNITDEGLIAVNNFEKLKYFSLGLIGTNIENKFITDYSLQRLFSNTIENLDLSNCIHVTNSSVIGIVENLLNLKSLDIKNTKVTIEVIEDIAELTKYRQQILMVFVSFKINDDYSRLLTNPAVRFFGSFVD